MSNKQLSDDYRFDLVTPVARESMQAFCKRRPKSFLLRLAQTTFFQEIRCLHSLAQVSQKDANWYVNNNDSDTQATSSTI